MATQRDLVQDRWDEEWLELVDPKILLSLLQGRTKVFGKHQILKKALMTRAGQDQQVRPPGVEEFRIKLERLRASV
ncbi:hypothetical protein AB0O76_03780 [Streptomyces sp. NPDC086554]|uniref:hypothetical protein n=1 Tax=Streptomyces sp. NPDC086554 TaxID=3154864 RepID=UPI00343E5BA0